MSLNICELSSPGTLPMWLAMKSTSRWSPRLRTLSTPILWLSMGEPIVTMPATRVSSLAAVCIKAKRPPMQ